MLYVITLTQQMDIDPFAYSRSEVETVLEGPAGLTESWWKARAQEFAPLGGSTSIYTDRAEFIDWLCAQDYGLKRVPCEHVAIFATVSDDLSTIIYRPNDDE